MNFYFAEMSSRKTLLKPGLITRWKQRSNRCGYVRCPTNLIYIMIFKFLLSRKAKTNHTPSAEIHKDEEYREEIRGSRSLHRTASGRIFFTIQRLCTWSKKATARNRLKRYFDCFINIKFSIAPGIIRNFSHRFIFCRA